MNEKYYCKCGAKATRICECGTVFCDNHSCDEHKFAEHIMLLNDGLGKGIKLVIGKFDKKTLEAVKNKMHNIARLDTWSSSDDDIRLREWLDKETEEVKQNE